MTTTTIIPALLSNADAAKYLAISVKSLYSLAKEGRITPVRIGPRCVKYQVAELDRFIAACRGGA